MRVVGVHWFGRALRSPHRCPQPDSAAGICVCGVRRVSHCACEAFDSTRSRLYRCRTLSKFWWD